MIPANENQNQNPNANAGNVNQNHNPNINVNPNVTVKVDVAGLDVFVQTYPGVRTEDIKGLFKVEELTKLHGEPTFDWLKVVEREMGRNALAIKVSVGYGKRGCAGVV